MVRKDTQTQNLPSNFICNTLTIALKIERKHLKKKHEKVLNLKNGWKCREIPKIWTHKTLVFGILQGMIIDFKLFRKKLFIFTAIFCKHEFRQQSFGFRYLYLPIPVPLSYLEVLTVLRKSGVENYGTPPCKHETMTIFLVSCCMLWKCRSSPRIPLILV